MSTTDVDWELKEGKLHFHGNLVKRKKFKEFNFLKKDFKSTISKKEEAQFLHQRFKILAHVLKENLSQNFYESTVNIAHPKPTFSDWTDSQWLGFSRKGTFVDKPKETIQFQVTIHPKDKQNNVLHVDLWLDGKANETRLRMLEQIKNNGEMFSELLKNIPGTYFIGIQKSHDDKELVEISKISSQFIENIIKRLTKKGTEFFIRKYYSEEEAINPDTKIINNIVDTFEKLIPASEFLNGNPKEKQSNRWWIISAGEDPVREKVWNEFRNSNTIGFYWNQLGDLSKLTEEQIKEKFKQIGIKEKGKPRFWDPARAILMVKKNDILFVKLGKRGFYGIGKATDTYQYNTNQSYHHTIPVQWITIQPYKKPEGYSLNLQLNYTMISIPDKNQEPELVKYYENAINGKTLTFEEEELDAVTLDTFDRALKLKPNLILYGPPGTGKTLNANEIAKHIIKKNNSFPTWKLCAKRILFENSGKSLPYTTITEQILDKKLRFKTSAETPQETVRSRLADDIKDNGTNSIFVKTDRGEYGFKLPLTFKAGIQLMLELNGPLSYLDMTKHLLEKNIIHTDGETPEKTLLAVITDEIKKNPDDSIFVQTSTPGTYDLRKKEVTTKSFVEKVTFHPSYSYEDFVEGFRPNQKEGETPYVLEKGIFQQICNTADKDPSNKYVLIIDEINRGNIPKILGELITLIEKDKRNSDDSLKLTYSKKPFFVPENLIIIGTMNTADKSLMQMDDALKRRFVFEELMPDTDLLEKELKKNNVPKAEDYSKILKRINEKITGDGKNSRESKEALIQFRDRQIGHSYFWNIGKENNPDEDLQSIIKYDVIPLLQDYFYGNYELVRKILGKGEDEKESFDIIGKDNRTTELVNDISKSSDLKNYLLEI